MPVVPGTNTHLPAPTARLRLRACATLHSGELLLFLQAASIFPASGLRALCAALDRDARVPGGTFRVLFDGTGRFAHGLTAAYPWLRWFTLYYGDSGIFVRR